MWKFLRLQIILLGGDSMWSSVSYGVMLYQSINVINNCKVNTFWHSGKTGVSKGRFT